MRSHKCDRQPFWGPFFEPRALFFVRLARDDDFFARIRDVEYQKTSIYVHMRTLSLSAHKENRVPVKPRLDNGKELTGNGVEANTREIMEGTIAVFARKE